MRRVAIIGSQDMAKYMAHHLNSSDYFETVGFFDDFTDQPNGMGPLLGKTSQIEQVYKQNQFDSLLVGIGYKHMPARKEMFNKFQGKIPFAIFSHASCSIDSTATLDEGCFLGPQCVLDRNVRVNANCFFNPSVTIAHDTHVGPHNFFAPSVSLAGFVQTEEQCFFGIHSTVSDNKILAAGTRIGAGCTLIESTQSPGWYVGQPARLKE